MKAGVFTRLDAIEAAMVWSRAMPLANVGEHLDRAEAAFMERLDDTFSLASIAAAEAAYAAVLREYSYAG